MAEQQRGQALAIITVFMLGLLGMAALSIDVGRWYTEKRAVQSAADSSALAGASRLPVSWASAQAAASSQFDKNKQPGDNAIIVNTSNLVANDSVHVTVTRSSQSFFAQVLGKGNVTIRAAAQATVKTPQLLSSRFNVMPWAVPQGDFLPAARYSIYTDNRNNANNGAVSLPYDGGGATCTVPSGSNPYENQIAGTLNVCPISVGQVIDLKTGNNTGPTAQGLNTRITAWKTFDQIVEPLGAGQFTILDTNSPQLVLIPIVVNLSGDPSWPHNAPYRVRVVGFAWFVIESCGPTNNPSYCRTSDGEQVNGRFVGLLDASSTNTTGAWNPTSTAYQVELTA